MKWFWFHEFFFFFSWLLSRQWHHPTVDPSPAWWYRKPIVCARIGIEFMCVCAVFKDLTKSQENVGLDRSYRGISLKLPLLYATICECRLPKALWFLSIDSQFHWFRVKTLKGKTRFGKKKKVIHQDLCALPFCFCCIPRPCVPLNLHCGTSRWIKEGNSYPGREKWASLCLCMGTFLWLWMCF